MSVERAFSLSAMDIVPSSSSSRSVWRLKSQKDPQAYLRQLDEEGILATPANSRYNELVMEAGRLSILNDAREVVIEYGASPGVRLRT